MEKKCGLTLFCMVSELKWLMEVSEVYRLRWRLNRMAENRNCSARTGEVERRGRETKGWKGEKSLARSEEGMYLIS